jgi:aminopeptidase N
VRHRALPVIVACLLAATACSGDDVLSEPTGSTATSAPDVTEQPRSTTTAPAETEGVAGDDGAGDPYFATLGNGGYDVARYDMDLTVDSSTLSASVSIEATATEDLDTFNLDFAAYDIESVDVDGARADHQLAGEELVIDPDPVIEASSDFVVEVRYRGRPRSVPGAGFGQLGWQQVAGVTFVSDEPFGAHSWFPSNDHPSDKAAFRITITVPDGTTAVASGVLASQESAEGHTTTVWDHPDPIPTYLVAVAIGPLTVVEREGPHGIHIRHAFPPALAEQATRKFVVR